MLVALWCAWPVVAGAQARVDVIEFTSRLLRKNPLGDPANRRLAVFIPAQGATNQTPLPMVYYLPGYGGSTDGFLKDREKWIQFTQKIADEITPVRWVVVDGRTRWGGSQYLDSPAQGDYAAYVCDEIRSKVEERYRLAATGPRRIVAGHSSGGFGALRLGMLRPCLFDAVIALSPDSDFPVSHLHLMMVPGVTNLSLAQIQAIMRAGPQDPPPKDGDLRYALGLSAAYAPRGRSHPGEFEWLFDARGVFRPEVWQRWLNEDPLTLVRKNPHAFRSQQTIYVDGPSHDQYLANIGGRKMVEVLATRPQRCAFYEPPGQHSDHLRERLERALAWTFGRPTKDL